MLYLEDIHVGDRFISREYEMTLEEIKQFAQAYDPQPFHLDEEKAAEHPVFQGLAASGWHTAAVTMYCLFQPQKLLSLKKKCLLFSLIVNEA